MKKRKKRISYIPNVSDLKGEIWVPIKDCEEFYWISNMARVRSRNFFIQPVFNHHCNRLQIMTYVMQKDGTKTPSLRNLPRLFLETFNPIDSPEDYWCLAKDGDYTNITLDNLFWEKKKIKEQSIEPKRKRNVLTSDVAIKQILDGKVVGVYVGWKELTKKKFREVMIRHSAQTGKSYRGFNWEIITLNRSVK